MVSYSFCDSPIGKLVIAAEDGCVISIGFSAPADGVFSPSASADLAALQLSEYFGGSRKSFDFPIRFSGTGFQKAVWNVLIQIPYGQTKTYGDIAAAIGNPKAARAVGMACNKNPLWIAIPCHRVVGKNQSLTGYAGGIDAKEYLLHLERTHK